MASWMDHSVDKELATYLNSETYSLRLTVQAESSDKWVTILGPALFNFFISNKDREIESNLIKSINNTKLHCVVHVLEKGDILSREMWTALRGGPTWTSSSSVRPSAKPYTCVIQVRREWIESNPWEKDWECWLKRSSTKANNMLLQPRNTIVLQAASKEIRPVGQGRQLSHSTPHEAPTAVLHSDLKPPAQGDGTVAAGPQESQKDNQMAEAPLLQRHAARSWGLFNMQKGKHQADVTAAFRHLKEACKK